MAMAPSSNNENNDISNTSATELADAPRVLQWMERLPIEIRAMEVREIIPPRILDTRLRTQLAPSVLAHISQTMRRGIFVGTQSVPPQPTDPPFVDPLTGLLSKSSLSHAELLVWTEI